MKKAVTTTDAEWLAEITKSGAYEGIDIPTQLKRAEVWCGQNRRQLTRRFFINWLNRCDRPMKREGGSGPAGRFSGSF